MCDYKKQAEEDLIAEGGIKVQCTECGMDGLLLPKSKITNYIKSMHSNASKIILSSCEQHKEKS